jgi:hypothetical protein
MFRRICSEEDCAVQSMLSLLPSNSRAAKMLFSLYGGLNHAKEIGNTYSERNKSTVTRKKAVMSGGHMPCTENPFVIRPESFAFVQTRLYGVYIFPPTAESGPVKSPAGRTVRATARPKSRAPKKEKAFRGKKPARLIFEEMERARVELRREVPRPRGARTINVCVVERGSWWIDVVTGEVEQRNDLLPVRL